MASSKVFYGVVVTLVCTAAISTVTFPRDAQSGSVRPGTLSAADLASLYGRGEGEGCEALLNEACSTTKNEITCYQWVGLEDMGCAKKTGRTYSGFSTYSCGRPQNTKVGTYIDIPCYKDTDFEEWWGIYASICVTDPLGDYCYPAYQALACGVCYPKDDDLIAWTSVESCVCEDP
jgi:hypothetical protein